MCCADAPDTSGINEQARASAEIAREALDWFKQEFANTAPDRAAATERQNKVSDAQLEGMQFANQQAREANERNRRVFQPVENRIASESLNYDTAGRRQQAAAEARAGVETAYGGAMEGMTRELGRRGVMPGGNKSQALMQSAALDKARAITGATSAAEKNVEAQGYARMMDAAGLGRGVVSNQATQQQIATTTGNASAGTAGQALGSATSGAGLMQTGFGQGLQGMGQAGSLYGQAAGIDSASRGQDLNFLSNAFGSFMKASSKKVKKDIKPASPDAALAEINQLDAKHYNYDPAKGGPPGMGPQTGPMAEQTQQVMGDQVAPGGNVIDMRQMGGKLLLGMQALTQRIDQLERKAA